jgi:hypothetical protein
MGAKYRACQHLYEKFYAKLIRPKLVDFLSDERKRKLGLETQLSPEHRSH